MTALYVYNCSLQWKPLVLAQCGLRMSRLVVTSRSEEDRVVSVPAEGSITSSVSSIVNMVGSCVGRGSVGGSIGVTARNLGVSTIGQGAQLVTVQFVLHLPGLSHQAGHSVDGESLTQGLRGPRPR